eukprot:1858663-Rhodomonas_salina.2
MAEIAAELPRRGLERFKTQEISMCLVAISRSRAPFLVFFPLETPASIVRVNSKRTFQAAAHVSSCHCALTQTEVDDANRQKPEGGC